MAALPEAVRAAAAAEISTRLGRRAEVLRARELGGGCIHHAAVLETTEGSFFLKWSHGEAGVGFGAEARGLGALREAVLADGILRIPEVVAVRDAAAREPGWLLLDYLPPCAPGPGYHRRLGEGLAALHARGLGPRFGWAEDNRIGSLPQSNPWSEWWPGFWRDSRLRPHLQAAFAAGSLLQQDRGWAGAVLDTVEPALAPVAQAPPSLLHGDLWSGNVHPGPGGEPVLVDPAAYLGAGEVDLAMMELFGGFREETFRAYAALRPAPPGYAEVRHPLYQLYYLLVHLRLFGAGYLGETRSAARTFLDAMG